MPVTRATSKIVGKMLKTMALNMKFKPRVPLSITCHQRDDVTKVSDDVTKVSDDVTKVNDDVTKVSDDVTKVSNVL